MNLYRATERRTVRLPGALATMPGTPPACSGVVHSPCCGRGGPSPSSPCPLCAMPTTAEPPGLAAWGLLCPGTEDQHINSSAPSSSLWSRKHLRKGRWDIALNKLRALVLTILWACWGPLAVLEKKGVMCELLVKGMYLEGRKVGVTDKSPDSNMCTKTRRKCKDLFLSKFLHSPKSPGWSLPLWDARWWHVAGKPRGHSHPNH